MPDNIDSLQIEISANASKAEKSLNKLASSLGKIQSALSGIDSGRFQNLSSGILQLSNSMERFSSSVKTADFTRIATGLNKLSSVNVQGVSDASRAINTLTANLGNLGTIAFDSQGIANIANSVAQLGRKTVTQAGDNIPKLTSSLGGLVSGLSEISSSSIDVSGLSQLTSSITKLGGKSATAAAGGNIDKLAESLKKMMTTLSTSPRVSQNLIQMTQALAQLASTGSKAGAATVNLSRSFGTLPTAANKAKTSFNGLASAIGKFYATYWLLIRALGSFKKAIDISSDLTEVQNVVDVSFGSMSDKMNEFADSALELYGMSELTAKQIGSRFQAMGVSMGFAQEDMTDMSIRLTQLAGDLASFYNITQDEAATKLQSIFTGESEPLRSLGIDLAQTSVEAWALSQGIDADMRSMTNAEKTMLRYQYVLASTGQATNDFQRTSDTWANSLRRLTGSFEQLGSIVGGVLINAFKPFVQALNSVMQAVISFAQVVSDALGAIFGWKYQTGGGVAQDLEMGAAAAEDIENATGGAADNAKKLKSYTLGIDELNILEPDDGSGSGSGGGGAGGAGGGAGASGGEWVQTESLWEKYTSSIDSLYDLGDYIGNALTQAMNSIDWDSVYQSASNFGSGLASFLNGLISPELFGALGTTIAGALNTALYALNSFGTTFDWTDFGNSIATSINNFFSTFDFNLLADTINTWANGLLDAMIAALKKVEWDDIGTRIGTFLSRLDFTGILSKIGRAMWEAINAAFELYEGMFETAPLETALLTLVGVTKLLKTDKIKKFVAAISSGISTATTFTSALGGSKTALSSLQSEFPKLGSAVEIVTRAFQNFKFGVDNGNLFTGLSEGAKTLNSGIESIRSNLSGVQKVAITAASGFAEFSLISDSVSDLATGTGNVAANLIELASGAAIGAAGMYTALGPGGLAIAALTGLVAAFKGVQDAVSEIDAERASNDIYESLANPGGVSIEELSDNFSDSLDEISAGFENIGEKTQEIDTANESIRDTWTEIERIETAMNSGVLSVEEGTAKLTQLFSTLASTAEQKFASLETTLLTAFGDSGALSQVYERIGVSTESTMQTVLQVNATAMERIKDITSELSTLDPTNPHYAELRTELAELIGTTDEVSRAISDYELKVEGIDIDYSGLLGDDNQLDSTKLTNFLDQITGAIGDANTDIESGISGIKIALTEELNAALSVGDMQSAQEIREQLDALPTAMDMLKSDISVKGTELSTAVQIDFLGKIDDEIEAAQNRWENMNILEKFMTGFSTEDQYVYDAVQDFKTGYIDPLTNEIETAYNEVGVQGAGFASKAAEEMINSMFDTVEATSGDGVTRTIPTLKEDYESMFSQALSDAETELTPKIENTGRNVNSTLGGAISANMSLATTPMGTVAGAVLTAAEAGLGLTNSPSTMEGYGENVVSGLNAGIENNQGSSESVIGTWVSNLLSWFKTPMGINSPSTVFNGYGENAIEGFNNGLSKYDTSEFPINTWVTNILSWFNGGEEEGKINSSTFLGFANDIITGFREGINKNFGQSELPVTTWVTNIKSWFNGGNEEGKINSNTFLGFAKDTVDGFCDGIELNFGRSESPISTWVAGILSWFNGGDEEGKINDSTFGSFASEIIEGFKKKIGDTYQDTRQNIETWADKIKEWFWGDAEQNEDTGLGKKFKDFGKWIMTGLKNGLESMKDTVMGLIEDIADSINDLMEKEEEIGSPSKRFFRYGAWMMEGLENGLNSGAIPMMNSLSTIAQSIPMQFEPVTGSFSVNSAVPSYGFSVSSFAMPEISAQEQTYTGDEMLVRALETVLDTRLIPIIQSASTSRDELLQTIADKDTNTYIDGRKVNRILNNQQSRSGYSIRK